MLRALRAASGRSRLHGLKRRLNRRRGEPRHSLVAVSVKIHKRINRTRPTTNRDEVCSECCGLRYR